MEGVGLKSCRPGAISMSCSSWWCTLWEALSRALPPGLAEALKPGHAGDICTGDICTCLSTPQGKRWRSNWFQSACLKVVERRDC